MALTESTMLKLGSSLPTFELPNVVTGQQVSSSDFANKPLLVMFICNHCPYVIHLSQKLAELTKVLMSDGVGVIGISSNDVDEYPADSPEKMKEEVELRGYKFPYLYDESQRVAKSFTAACTPDFFLYDSNHQLCYRGRFDETRPTRIRSGVYESSSPSTGDDLMAAVDAMQSKTTPVSPQLPSLGCNIKWKAKNESRLEAPPE